MRLYLMRHGEAAAMPHEDGRILTGRGRAQTRNVAAEVARRHRTFAGGVALTVLTSPLVRAIETAGILAEETTTGSPEVVSVLESGVRPAGMLDLVRERRELPAIAMVGHMPEMGELGWWLATGKKGGAFALSPSSVVFLDLVSVDPEVEAGESWVLAPEDLS